MEYQEVKEFHCLWMCVRKNMDHRRNHSVTQGDQIFGDLAQKQTLNVLLLSQLIVPDTVTRPRIERSSPFPAKIFRFTYQLIGSTLHLIFFGKFPNSFTERDSFPFLIRDEVFHPKYPNLHEINFGIASQPDFLSTNITRAIPENRSNDNIVDEIRSNQSMVTEKYSVQK